MIARAEELFGPYDWDRYDMLVLPPSFPYGGMENPRMTFLTPTLLAGDRSLVDVVAHELAHSWTGNLVTNADMEHFWLNEGFTVVGRAPDARGAARRARPPCSAGRSARRRSRSRSRASARARRSRGCAPSSPASIPTTPSRRSRTRRARASWRCSSARPAATRFDRFMRDYIESFRFTSITTEEFLEFLERAAAGSRRRRSARTPGSTSPACRRTRPCSARRAATRSSSSPPASRRAPGRPPRRSPRWDPAETLVYLQHLPRELDRAGCEWLDRALRSTGAATTRSSSSG